MAAALMKAADFAARAHATQRRKDARGTPYINHPIGVAHMLSSIGGIDDVHVLQAAMLHDTVEDTNTTLHDISTEFGNHVAAIVAEVTDDKSLSKQRRKELQISHAATCSREAKLVKMADKLYNLMDLQRELPRGWSVPRAQAYVGWSREVIEGCRGICQPLEAALDRVFDGTFVVDGQEVRCVPDQYVPGDWRKDTPVTD